MLGKIKGHVGEAKGRASEDKAQRIAAEKSPKSIILSKLDVQGEYDANRVLTTTLGGGHRSITADDLAAFRHNMRLVQNKFKGEGITARQVVDAASSRPIKYLHPEDQDGARSDIDKARGEITMAVPVSAAVNPRKTLDVRFITNAGKDSKVSRHHVLVRFNAFPEAAHKLMASTVKERKNPKQSANWLRKQKLAFDCDCERHRYFLRYVATIGGFNAGRDELGYPKIRNPGLKGVACKHVLRVMAEIDSSGSVWTFLAKQMEKVLASADNTARHQMKQAEADALAASQSAGPREIKTSRKRAAERRKAQEKAALHKAVQAAPRLERKPVSTRKIEAALASGKLTAIQVAGMRQLGFNDAQIAAAAGKG